MHKCDKSFLQLSVDSVGGIVLYFFSNHILHCYHISSEEDEKFFFINSLSAQKLPDLVFEL
jgi:hypothetical protein